MAATLLLPARVRAEIGARATGDYPAEACGLLLGRPAGDATRVSRQWPARNVEADRAGDRFVLDPLDYLAAETAAAASGDAVVGVWHSHPDHPARPSPTDRALAWPGWSYVIVAVSRHGVVDLRSWRLDGAGPAGAADFAEEGVVDE